MFVQQGRYCLAVGRRRVATGDASLETLSAAKACGGGTHTRKEPNRTSPSRTRTRASSLCALMCVYPLHALAVGSVSKLISLVPT